MNQKTFSINPIVFGGNEEVGGIVGIYQTYEEGINEYTGVSVLIPINPIDEIELPIHDGELIVTEEFQSRQDKRNNHIPLIHCKCR